jgi:hypothetical protein
MSREFESAEQPIRIVTDTDFPDTRRSREEVEDTAN